LENAKRVIRYCVGLGALACLLLPATAAAAPKKVPYDDLPLPIQPSFVGVSKWNHLDVTYGFVNGTGDIAGDGERQAVKEAFAFWAAHSPLSFSETSPASADIEISWGTGEHGDGFPFDGNGGVLAHAFYPSDGRIHFDDAETWTTATRSNSADPRDLITVAAHEIGHAIGLGHSADSSALMYEFYSGSHRFLANDDIEGITSLYPNPWRLRNTASAGSVDVEFAFGQSGDKFVSGDWDGNGTRTLGTYNPSSGVWKLRNSNSGGAPDITFQFGGGPWNRAIAGDWNGDGIDTIGVFDPSNGNWNLRDSNSAGGANHAFQYGGSPWTSAVVGDWNGDGTDTIGVYDPSAGNWNLRDSNSAGGANYAFQYGGGPWTTPVVGDWDGNGTDTIGVYDPSAGNWNLRDANSGGNPKYSFQYGGGVWNRAVTGDWDGNGTDTIGVVRD
jgi:hypothetical protein